MTQIVAFGDSITAGQHLDEGYSPWPYLLGEHLHGTAVVHPRGVPGDTTRLALERFPRDVQSASATAVIIQFGHNDCNRWLSDGGLPRVSSPAYAANLLEMILRCQAFGAQPFLCTLTPSHRNATHAADVEHYDLLLRHVAMDMDVPLIDVRDDFGDDEGLLLDDGLHLSFDGHLRYAASVGRVLAEVLG